MASSFRAFGEGDGGEASPPAAGPSRPSRWLSGLISGAGRLISSVLDSSPSDDEGDASSDSDEGEDTDASADDLVELNKRRKKSKVAIGSQEGSHAIVTKNGSKHTIEQLLMEETFSRDECDKLTKIIQSRVGNLPSIQEFGDGIRREFLNGTSSKKISFSDAWKTLDQVQKIPETIPSVSTGWQVPTPDHHGTVVREARKWLEEKRSASSSKSDFVYGPCTPNVDTSLYHVEGEVGSPVEVAKSYMSSLSPWQSPLFRTGCRNTPSSVYQLSDYGAPHDTARHAVSSVKALKRRYLSFESGDTDGTWRTGARSIENQPESFKFQQLDSFAQLLGHSSATDNRERAHSLNIFKAVDTNVPANMSRKTPGGTIFNGEYVTNSACSTHLNSTPVNLPAQLNSGVRSEPISCVPAAILPEEMGVEEPSQTKNSACVCFTTHSLDPASMGHDGANAKCPLNSKQRTKSSEKSKSMPSSSGGLITIPVLLHNGSLNSTYTNNSELVALDISGGFCETTTRGLPVETKCSGGKPRKGTNMRSIKQVLSESQPSPSRHQDRKVASKPKRGRGRGRGRGTEK